MYLLLGYFTLAYLFLSWVEMLQLWAKFQTLMASCSGLIMKFKFQQSQGDLEYPNLPTYNMIHWIKLRYFKFPPSLNFNGIVLKIYYGLQTPVTTRELNLLHTMVLTNPIGHKIWNLLRVWSISTSIGYSKRKVAN